MTAAHVEDAVGEAGRAAGRPPELLDLLRVPIWLAAAAHLTLSLLVFDGAGHCCLVH